MAERLYPMTMTAGSVSLLAAHPLGVEATLAWMEYTDTQALTDMLLPAVAEDDPVECLLHGHIHVDLHERMGGAYGQAYACPRCHLVWNTGAGGWGEVYEGTGTRTVPAPRRVLVALGFASEPSQRPRTWETCGPDELEDHLLECRLQGHGETYSSYRTDGHKHRSHCTCGLRCLRRIHAWQVEGCWR